MKIMMLSLVWTKVRTIVHKIKTEGNLCLFDGERRVTGLEIYAIMAGKIRDKRLESGLSNG